MTEARRCVVADRTRDRTIFIVCFDWILPTLYFLVGSLALWQMSYRETFLQMIYMYDGEIMDCDFLTGQKYNEEFVQNFYNEIQDMKKHNKIIGLKEELYHMPKFRRYTHHNIPEISMSMDGDDEIIGARNLTYHPLFNQNDLPKDLLRVINFDRMKLECEAYHQNVMRHVRDLNSENADVVQNATEHLSRKKRTLSDWLIAPNTKWCGRGQTAEKYSQLGGASKADKCCRRHDHCKFNIYAMTTKWRLFNYRPFTISHCSCDMRFRTCLKMADSPDATMVGKLFFNIVQTKCFVLKPEKYCKSHSWWGACESESVRKRAHLRNNKKF
ncbi:phospholipase A2 hemilipin isoform X1 [Contarinia nasturtii]|uniref:phospholipase A2 hemilipin isoform X1 n=1 Tax=Contarinia nasturtii TaxID=265458 RepID=UPI0012D4BF5B|nr:phospholipase A2 hemilipin isoform X1 [Contarinia nasturtii]